jgi:hypothetical protein
MYAPVSVITVAAWAAPSALPSSCGSAVAVEVAGAAGIAGTAGATGMAEAAGATVVVSVHGASVGAVHAHARSGAAAKQEVKCATADAEKGSYTAKDGSRCGSPCSNRTSIFGRDSLTIACGVIGRRRISLPCQCS